MTSGEARIQSIRFLALAAAALVLTACGGGSDDSTQTEPSAGATTATPEPRDYTLEELEAALPAVEDVEQGTEVALTCPSDGPDRCGEETEVQTSIVISVGGATPIDMEVSGDSANYVAVRAVLYDTPEDAQAQMDRSAGSNAERDGDFDIAPEEFEGYTFPGAKGTGTVEELTIGAWTGEAADQAIVPEEDGAQVDLQNSEWTVVSGNVVVFVTANLTSEGRDADLAATLAETALNDYLERLDA